VAADEQSSSGCGARIVATFSGVRGEDDLVGRHVDGDVLARVTLEMPVTLGDGGRVRVAGNDDRAGLDQRRVAGLA
jgi:hypothetical protein